MPVWNYFVNSFYSVLYRLHLHTSLVFIMATTIPFQAFRKCGDEVKKSLILIVERSCESIPLLSSHHLYNLNVYTVTSCHTVMPITTSCLPLQWLHHLLSQQQHPNTGLVRCAWQLFNHQTGTAVIMQNLMRLFILVKISPTFSTFSWTILWILHYIQHQQEKSTYFFCPLKMT